MLRKDQRLECRPDKEMQTNRSNQARTRAFLFYLLGFFVFAVGCGGGGGGGDDDSAGNNPPPQNPPQQALAPESMPSSTVTLSEPMGEERQIEFNGDDGTWSNYSTRGDASGTYVYRRDAHNTATLTLNSTNGVEVIALTFSSEHNGFYNYTAGPPISGGFVIEASTDPGPTPEPPSQPPKTGYAPSSLAGKTMYGTRTATSTGPKGQTHVYTFTTRTFHDSDPPEESDGNYTYTPNRNQAQLELDYTFPKEFDGDHHVLQMTFTSETHGTFTSVYTRRDGTVIMIDGYFEVEE